MIATLATRRRTLCGRERSPCHYRGVSGSAEGAARTVGVGIAVAGGDVAHALDGDALGQSMRGWGEGYSRQHFVSHAGPLLLPCREETSVHHAPLPTHPAAVSQTQRAHCGLQQRRQTSLRSASTMYFPGTYK